MIGKLQIYGLKAKHVHFFLFDVLPWRNLGLLPQQQRYKSTPCLQNAAPHQR